jgi:hypothetical protein
MKLAAHGAVVGTVDGAGASDLTWAVGCMRTGVLLGPPSSAGRNPQIENLAATLPEVFGTVDAGWLERIAAQLEAEPGEHPFGELLLLSEQHVHVIQPLRKHRGVALLAVSAGANAIGLVLSQVHAQVAALEREE